jgi:hypothetical protein
LTCSNYPHADAMDSGSLEGHHMNQEVHNLEDVEELDDDEEMLSPEDIDLNAEPEPRQRNEDIQEGMYFKTTTLMCFLC